MSEKKPINITDADFEEKVIDSKGISVVDFWAPWCGPCHTMAPALEAFALANEGKLKVNKLDVDDNPKTSEKFQIRSIPTVMFFKDGEAVDTHIGAMTESSLEGRLNDIL